MVRFIHRRRKSPLPPGTFAQGGHRFVSRVQSDDVEWVEKHEHAKRESTVFGVPIRLPMRFHTRLKNAGITPNELEWKHFRTFFTRVPKELRSSFAQPYGISKTNKGTTLYMEVVTNVDGMVSRSLAEEGLIRDPHFWKRFDAMVHWMRQQGIVHFALKPENIVVKHVSSAQSIPVLVDYKNMDPRRYFLQPWLAISSLAQKKMLRRYERLRKKYSPITRE